MHVLTSDWLRRMVGKAGATPQSRIIALFDILQDWMDAPGLREKLHESALAAPEQRELKAYLLQLSAEAGVADPEALSNQLLFMLLGAVQQEQCSPGCVAFEQAGQVARMLLAGQRRQRQPAIRGLLPAMAAMLVVVLLAPRMMGMQDSPARTDLTLAVPALAAPALSTPNPAPAAMQQVHLAQVNPDKLAAVYHMHSVIRSGQCWYPQALMLPPEQRAIFLENVVFGGSGDISPRNLELVTQLYKKVECYYPPAALT